jgi:hypothetical protein
VLNIIRVISYRFECNSIGIYQRAGLTAQVPRIRASTKTETRQNGTNTQKRDNKQIKQNECGRSMEKRYIKELLEQTL